MITYLSMVLLYSLQIHGHSQLTWKQFWAGFCFLFQMSESLAQVFIYLQLYLKLHD